MQAGLFIRRRPTISEPPDALALLRHPELDPMGAKIARRTLFQRHPRACPGDHTPHCAGTGPRDQPGDDVEGVMPRGLVAYFSAHGARPGDQSPRHGADSGPRVEPGDDVSPDGRIVASL
jgi:hypothetical protein